MGRSNSSDSDDGRRKKKKSRRSRSRSISSNRRRSRRSRSRSLSHDRRKKSRRSRSRSSSHSRSKRQEKSNKELQTNRSKDRSERIKSKDQYSGNSDKRILRNEDYTAADLKEKIRSLNAKTINAVETIYKPSEEEIMKIEEGGFVQEHFSKTYNQDNPVQSAKSKKKKKKKHQQKQLLSVDNSDSSEVQTSVSHVDVIFGKTDLNILEKLSLDKVKSKPNDPQKIEGDSILGYLFHELPEKRTGRWHEKLSTIQKKLSSKEFE